MRNTNAHLSISSDRDAVAHSAGEPPGKPTVPLSYADRHCSNVL